MQGTGLRTSQIGTALSAALLLGSACAAARPDIIQVGPWFPAKPAAEVAEFSSKEQTVRPWGAIAIIHGAKFPPGARAALDRQRKLARKMAAGVGADGVIIAEETLTGDPRLGVYQEPETFISALAFKYVTDVSTAAK